MTEHRIGTREEWLAAREQLLVREKEHTRRGDELAQHRRAALGPRRREYLFDTDDGEKNDELFEDGRSCSCTTSCSDRLHGRLPGQFVDRRHHRRPAPAPARS